MDRFLVSGLLVLAGCASNAVPSLDALFDPGPGHRFDGPSGAVKVINLSGHTVCVTTDGSEPEEQGDDCLSGQRLGAERLVALTCGDDTSAESLHTIALAFEWNGQHNLKARATYRLDCTPPPPDLDADDIDDDHDNCPRTPNPDQADSNGNGIGDACEGRGEPDADCDGRPDQTDNCPQVWNVSQADDDRDGVGSACDESPRGPAPLPYMNGTLARAMPTWFDEVRCSLNGCQDPGGLGTWMTDCSGGGRVVWKVATSGLRAISTFTYTQCAHGVTAVTEDGVTRVPLTVIVDGTITQDTDFSGNGSERGTVAISGDFQGQVSSNVVIDNRKRSAGSSFDVACVNGPVSGERCAPNNAAIRYVFPDWSCAPGACPTPPAPLVDTDGDGVFDPWDTCPQVVNADQADVDFDGMGDACDPSPGQCVGVPDGGLPPLDGGAGLDAGVDVDAGLPFALLKVKLGRCLYDDGAGNVRSTGACDASKQNQRWVMEDLSSGNRRFQNRETGKCLTSSTWAGAITMAACGTPASEWRTQRYDQGGFDAQFPLRLRADLYNYCLYTDGTGLVYATQGNCDLLGTQDNRKVGVYADGDFSLPPVQP